MLSRLVEEIRREPDPERVAEVLARCLHQPLLTPAQCAPDPDGYRQHVLHVEPGGAFSLVSLVWLPGQATCVHDHVSWCVVGTYLGAEEETSYRLDRDRLTPLATTVNPQGSATWLRPPGDIHRVRNATGGLVISIHVYGADVLTLGSSIRRRYPQPVG
ncbi:cysteine dioxygenase family protein [Catellatospora tritici]|uniref:cysteine dioxygenase family protein n=1 Tax=Catellatospora tritici TaxID=2851566 RepID=UPI001C2DE9A0|nr:cysteine dioxygenase family protein [Catellatospora tritici]MBV1851315.1 cysteine dioxygenase family protein [Catellatospora tritici]